MMQDRIAVADTWLLHHDVGAMTPFEIAALSRLLTRTSAARRACEAMRLDSAKCRPRTAWSLLPLDLTLEDMDATLRRQPEETEADTDELWAECFRLLAMRIAIADAEHEHYVKGRHDRDH